MSTKNFVLTLVTNLLLIWTPTAYAAGKALVSVTAKAVSNKKLELTFKTQPADGLVINHDGPWKLEIKEAGAIKPDKSEWKRAEWKEEIGGFIVTADPAGQKSADIKYKLIAFVCTKDKSQCFREVVENSAKVAW